MKKIYSFVLTLALGMVTHISHAQCTIDNSLTTDFAEATPSDIGVYCQDASVSQDVQVITVNQVSTAFGLVSVQSIEIQEMENVPTGFSSTPSCPSNCTFASGTDGFVRGCLTISGTPTEVFDDSIRIPLRITTNIAVIDTVVKAKIVVKDASDASCLVDGLQDFEIASNLSIFPNPSNGNSNVSLTLPEGASVRMAIYDVLGNKVSTLHTGFLGAGNNSIAVNNISDQGMYLLKVEIDSPSGTNSYTERIIVE